jgi:hypothetical protein
MKISRSQPQPFCHLIRRFFPYVSCRPIARPLPGFPFLYAANGYLCLPVAAAMTRASSQITAYKPLLRKAGGLAGSSFLLALVLVLYLYGTQDEFFGRFFGAFFVFFWLFAVTFLGVVPFIHWATVNWFGKHWTDDVPPMARRRGKAAASPPSSRTSTRTAPRLNPTQHP